MKGRSVVGGPAHLEAYPRLNLRDAWKHAAKGRPVVLWRDRGEPVDVGRVRFDHDNLWMTSSFRWLPHLPDGDRADHFACRVDDSKETGSDVLSFCSGCDRAARILILADDEWACADCQGLKYRKSLLGKWDRLGERLIELEALIGDGRAKSMRAKTYDRLKPELDDLRLEVGDREIIPRSDLAINIVAEWVADGPEVDEMALADGT